MCGFAGEIRFDGSEASTASVVSMSAALGSRGPDASGVHAQGPVAFAHRRLKIIDLSERGQQPMTDPELGLSLVFNGCIYNHLELRSELQALGYHFFSNSDTEVISKAYAAWGVDCVRRFQGMFAFALLERDTGRLVLGRDRLGIKPLYYTRDAKRLRFASTLPALLAAGDVDTSIDPIALHHYMTFHAVVPAPRTLLNGVRKLQPATVYEFDRDGASREHSYWSLDFSRDPRDIERSASSWREELQQRLQTAVQRRMIADVPVGVLLSGGVDSSLIVALLAAHGQSNLQTFSIGFEDVDEERGDEFAYSDLVASRFDTHHHRIFVPTDEMLDAIPATLRAMSEPMVSYDNVGFYLLSREVSRHVSVVQSGQGADEVFAGYHWYPTLEDSNDACSDYARVFFDRDHGEFAEAIDARFVGDDFSFDYMRKQFDLPGAELAVDKALRLDSTVMLVDDPVKRVDNMTMAWGLEARVPFLDHELVEFAARIPPEHKLAGGGKGVLKDVARELLPADVVDRRKGYFPVPALKYLRGRVLDLVRETLHSRSARERGLFNREYVDRLIAAPDDHITPLRGSKLWQVATLEMWLQANGVGAGA